MRPDEDRLLCSCGAPGRSRSLVLVVAFRLLGFWALASLLQGTFSWPRVSLVLPRLNAWPKGTPLIASAVMEPLSCVRILGVTARSFEKHPSGEGRIYVGVVLAVWSQCLADRNPFDCKCCYGTAFMCVGFVLTCSYAPFRHAPMLMHR